VYLIGEIKRGRAAWQVDHFAEGRECVDAILIKLETKAINEISVVGSSAGLGGLEQLAHPLHLTLIARVKRTVFLVTPARRHSEFRLFVHLVRADLDFYRLPARTDHGDMNRAIEIIFGCGDIVVKLTRYIPLVPVHDAKCGVAIGHARADDAHVTRVK